jgi:hypothetical protein
MAAQGEPNRVYLADALSEFEKNSPHGIPGNELLLEHVHLNFKGNYILAKTVFGQIESLLPWSLKGQEAEENSEISLTLCADYLVYEEAVEELRSALRIEPNASKIREKLDEWTGGNKKSSSTDRP